MVPVTFAEAAAVSATFLGQIFKSFKKIWFKKVFKRDCGVGVVYGSIGFFYYFFHRSGFKSPTTF